MNRLDLVDNVRDILARAGFYLSEKHNEKGISFDIIARKDNQLLIVGVFVNADSSRVENARELQILSNALNGSPLFIALKGGERPLEQGVIYSRRGIPLLSPNTLSDLFLEGIPPYVFSAPGGFYVSIDSDILRYARSERKMSLGTLAEIAGVSRKAIQKYEEGMGVDLDVALRMEEFFGMDMIMPLNPLEYDKEGMAELGELNVMDEFQKFIFETLLSVGYDMVSTYRCPFEAITSDKDFVLLSGMHSKGDARLREKAKIVSNISHVTEKESVIFIKRSYDRINLEGTPLIARRDLIRIESKSDVQDLLRERGDQS